MLYSGELLIDDLEEGGEKLLGVLLGVAEEPGFFVADAFFESGDIERGV